MISRIGVILPTIAYHRDRLEPWAIRKPTAARPSSCWRKAARVVRVSSLYCTEPIGYKEQDDFVNAVAAIETDLSPEELLRQCRSDRRSSWGACAPSTGGRVRSTWTSCCTATGMIETPELIIPHPLLHNRRFVLVPLCEIAPHAVHPKLQKTASAPAPRAATTEHGREVRCDENGTPP